MKHLLLLLLLASCATKTKYEPIPEVVVKDPATLPVEVNEPPVIVLDQESLKDKKNYFKLWDGLTTSKEALEKLIPVANCILNNEDFLNEMRSAEFTNTDKTGEQVVSMLQNSGTVSTVSTYRNSRFSPFTTMAYTEQGTIYMNTRYKFQATTLVHEHWHTLKFSHRSAKDFKSVPYQAGILAEKYVEKCK